MKKCRTGVEQKKAFNVKTWFRNISVQKKNGQSPVYVYVYCKRVKCVFNTGVYIYKEFWNYESLRVKSTHEKYKDYNLIIDNCKAVLHEIFVKYRLQREDLTPQLLKKEYETFSSYTDFHKFAERTMIKLKDTHEKRTLDHHKAIFHKLKLFKDPLMFTEIDAEFINKYKIHLQKKYKNSPATIYNNMAKVKAYLNIAKREGIIRRNPFVDVKLIKASGEREYLNEAELNAVVDLYEKNYLPENYQRTLRYFLFSCFTSLRISDVRSLTKEMIINNTIIYTPHKTGKIKPKPVKIPIVDYAKKLMKDESTVRLHGLVFHLLPDSKINLNIKEIVKVAKINRPITFNAARHTFATNFIKRGGNVAVLQKLMGHSSIKTTMVYLHVLGEDLVSEMNKFNEIRPVPKVNRRKQ